MFEFVAGLFDTTGFVPRARCGAWTPGLTWMHVGSDLFIWLAYLSIPLVLLYFTRRRDLPHPRLFMLFALFILACGFGHLIEALMFRYPLYRLAGAMKVFTAVVSWATVIALIPVIPHVMETISTSHQSPGAGNRLGDTTLHQLAVPLTRSRANDYVVAILAAVMALLLRAALDPVVDRDHVFVLSMLAVVFVSWRSGFGPGIATLLVSMVGMVYFFIPTRHTFAVVGFGNQLATAMFFFCGVCCAGLGEGQWVARRRAKAALAVALERKADLEIEVARRREVEFSLRQRESELTELNRKLATTQERTTEALAQLEALVLNAPVGIAFFDPDLRSIRVNRVFAQEQQPIAERRRQTIQEIIPGFRPELVADCERVLQSGQPLLDRRLTVGADRSKPEAVWQVSVFPVAGADGQQLGLGAIGQNVTERERVADALRESEERFRSMADSVPMLIWLSDLGQGRTYFNKTWLEFTGRSPEQELGQGWIDDVHPEYRDRYLEAYTTAFAARKPFEVEYRLRRYDGEYRWVLARGTPRFTPSGGFAGFVGLCLDVTDRKAADEAVRRSERNLADFFENANVGLQWVGPDGTILRANRAELEMLGYTREEYVGRPVSDFHADPETFRADFDRMIRGERIDNCPARLRCKDGSIRNVLISSTGLWEDGRLVHARCFTRDVTEHKLAEEHLRTSEARYRTLSEAIPQIVWTANPRGEVTSFNPRWEEYVGRSLSDVGPTGWINVVHPEDRDRFRGEWQMAAAQQTDEFTTEFRLRRRDGVHRWMLLSAVALRDPTGAMVEWVGSITDVDDRKRQSETLEQMVLERTAALVDEVEERKRVEQQVRAVAMELTRSNSELEQFAYVASHDLQEPLRKIQAFGDRLRNRFREQLPDTGRDYVDRMYVSAGRMQRLIEDLLAFSRVTTHARPFSRIDLGKLMREVVSDLEERIEQSGGSVEVGDLPEIDADPTQMRQLFQNLIANAVKFHRQDVVPLVAVRGELVTEPLPGSEGQSHPVCRIIVRDNGIGFDEKYLDRIFQVFQRLHGRDEYEGTGVGLAICRKIVERHGGTITAQSRAGEGATFVTTLPLRQPREETAADGRLDQEDHHDSDGR